MSSVSVDPPLPADKFQERLLAWFDRFGRKDLPWQHPAAPYRVWLSEIMLQQTQVATVVPYFERFVMRFPELDDLAAAGVDDVLALWAGLGYYARARNLHKTARLIAERGRFPDTLSELMALPGIGRSTAGAILSIAFASSHPILDGNVKRVLARFAAVPGWPGLPAVSGALWRLSAFYTPDRRCRDYTQAIMDLGATVCTRARPLCALCPLASACRAHLAGTAAAFPEPRPVKTLPVKQRVWLLACSGDGEILLEKRPPAGIWGGLWSVPEFDTVEMAEAWCREQGFGVSARELWATRRHSFSHYHLDYTPLLLRVAPAARIGEAGRFAWRKPAQLAELGLPAPVRSLLAKALPSN